MQFIISLACSLRYQQGEILERIAHRPLRDVFRKFRLHARALVFRRLQDARYVIHTIIFFFFAVSCPENSAFFQKNRQFFENIPRKILHILNILEKCCIFEKSRKNLVKFGENSAKIQNWQNLRNL